MKPKWICFFSQEWILNTTINERFRAFYLGFHSVCASNALIMLRPEEVEQVGIRKLELSLYIGGTNFYKTSLCSEEWCNNR